MLRRIANRLGEFVLPDDPDVPLWFKLTLLYVMVFGPLAVFVSITR